MQVLSRPGDEVIVQVVLGGGHTWHLLLHGADQCLSDLVQLITGKKVRNLAKGYV